MDIERGIASGDFAHSVTCVECAAGARRLSGCSPCTFALRARASAISTICNAIDPITHATSLLVLSSSAELYLADGRWRRLRCQRRRAACFGKADGREHTMAPRVSSTRVLGLLDEYSLPFLVLATDRVALDTTRHRSSSAGLLLAHTRVALGGVESTP